MKVCLCASMFKRILKAARKGGFKGAVQKVTSKEKVGVRRKNAPKRKGKRGKSGKQSSQQAKFRRAAKKCKGKGKGFRPCMKKELKKRR